MKGMIFALSTLLSSMAFADSHGESWAGLNLSEASAMQMQLCSLEPRKTMADYDKVFNAYIEWSKENDVQTYAMRATPLFGGPVPGSGMDFQWIDMLVSPFAVSGNGWDKWMNTESGQKLNKQWQETANCRVAFHAAASMFLDREALTHDSRVISLNWCTRNDGVTWDNLMVRHTTMAASRPDGAPVKAWTLLFPSLGIRNAPGEFAHMLSFADTAGLMAWENQLPNDEGWRQREDYQTSYVSCTGPNVYRTEILNRP